ncbi:MAG TPA: TIGR03435 family protein [Bryobacteraceae bacterium]|nr:TIGR03435 family protein [Bryobacteraceae bacterium]
MRVSFGSLLIGVIAIGSMFGQSSTTPPTFEVASIKPASGDEHRIGFQMLPGGGLRTMGTSLKTLVTFAYDVRDFQIAGGPAWINSDRYDILAKAEAGSDSSAPVDPRNMSDAQMKTARELVQQRLQALLADRFKLVIHRDTKEQPIYALVVAKGGSKLKPSDAKSANRRMMMGRGMLNGEGVELAMLANVLSNQLGRPVLDRTELEGHFDVKLEWTPDPGQSPGGFPGGTPPPGVQAPPPPDPNGPSIFTALQEQLGLRLESTKGPVEMIVVDTVEKPSEN